jgi:succinylglutamate desuccinylase
MTTGEVIERETLPERVLGEYSSGRAGPLMVFLGGVHGNEPDGPLALARVVETLERTRPPMRGRFLALLGNREALGLGVRFVAEDLNRIWSPHEVRALESSASRPRHERREQAELLGELRARIDGAADVTLVDLHSTSARGAPFVIVGDSLRNRRLALATGVPVILGLEENVEGTLLSYFGERGHAAIGFEGGRKGDPQTADHHEAMIWITLVSAGLLDEVDAPDLDRHRTLLARAAQGLPRVVEIRYRHALAEDERFAMEGHWESFQPVGRGQVLARSGNDLEREVRTPEDGFVLMPRYQGQGLDGFFLGRSVRPFWLHLSALLRRLHAERVLAWLPGVHRSDERPGSLVVDLRIARWFTTELFHLLGFRKYHEEAGSLVFTRRLEYPPARRR